MLVETQPEIILESRSETVAEMSLEKVVEIVSGKAPERPADVMQENANLSEIHMKFHGMESVEEREAMRGVQRGAQSEAVMGEAGICEEKLVVKSVVTAVGVEKTAVEAESDAVMKAWTREAMTRDREEDKFASRWWES
jgi:hypothetical protein